MKTYPTTSTNASDLKTLIGEPLSSEYSFQMQQAELADLLAEDMSDEREDWPGYAEWSEEVEQALFEQEQDEVKQQPGPQGPVYTSRECDHKECKSGRCEKAWLEGGFDL